MPTIIDSLIVKLGISGDTSSARKATKDLRDVETQADSTETSVKGLSQALTGLLAVIGGAVAIKAFVF